MNSITMPRISRRHPSILLRIKHRFRAVNIRWRLKWLAQDIAHWEAQIPDLRRRINRADHDMRDMVKELCHIEGTNQSTRTT